MSSVCKKRSDFHSKIWKLLICKFYLKLKMGQIVHYYIKRLKWHYLIPRVKIWGLRIPYFFAHPGLKLINKRVIIQVNDFIILKDLFSLFIFVQQCICYAIRHIVSKNFKCHLKFLQTKSNSLVPAKGYSKN